MFNFLVYKKLYFVPKLFRSDWECIVNEFERLNYITSHYIKSNKLHYIKVHYITLNYIKLH